MTAYFDQKGEELARLLREVNATSLPIGDFAREVERLEMTLVWDVSIATEFPNFPEDLAARVHKAVLKRGVYSQPVNNESNAPQFDTTDEHVSNIQYLVADLHTVFHDLCLRHLEKFGDDPRTPLRILYAKAEQKREDLVEGRRTSVDR